MSIWWPKICDDGMRKCASKSYREFESVMYNCTACVACSHQSMSESCIPLLFVSLKHSQSRCIFFSIPNASIGVYHFFVSSCLIFVYKKTKYHMFFSATWAHILISVLFYLNEWTSYILFFSVVIRPTMLFFSLHALLDIKRTQCTSIVQKKSKSLSVMQFIRCTH